ncbi:MAG: CBS domain-containing protein [Zhongshania aliphaticivorans]|jgi:CBS domain-containing protein
MKNVIPDRIADSLHRFPPFSMLKEEAIQSLAREASVKVLVRGEKVWDQDEKPGNTLYFLERGRVEYHVNQGGIAELVDVRDVGDLLGLTALYEATIFRVSADVVEDSLLYCFNWNLFEPLITENDEARNYIRRHLYWTTKLGGEMPVLQKMTTPASTRSNNILQAHLDGAHQIRPRNILRLLTCSSDLSVHNAAQQMMEKRVPSILVVNESRHPRGIVTYRDMVEQVIVQGLGKDEPVEKIMTHPVITIENQSNATAAILLMLRERIGQVCITEDGTDNSPALDVCTEKDLLGQTGHHPAGLLREIRHARTTTRLREVCDDTEKIISSYLEASISGLFIGQISAELYDELVQRLIQMALSGMQENGQDLSGLDWAWVSVGSDGRREQILRTDMDNAIIFKSSGSKEQDEQSRKLLTILAESVIQGMSHCGFARCQGGVMALNRKWCLSDQEWEQEILSIDAFTESTPLLRAIIIYDMRHVTGNKSLTESIRSTMFKHVAANQEILQKLANIAVELLPPLNFLGKFVVEKRGQNSGEFDIKNRTMAPLRQAAQAFAFKYQLSLRYSTGGRWIEIARHVENLRAIALLAQEAYDFLLRLRTMNGLKRGDSGRFIDPEKLTKMEKAQLVNVFDVVRMVQDALKKEFRLNPRRI